MDFKNLSYVSPEMFEEIQMKTKPELSNEIIAEALGFKKKPYSYNCWYLPNGDSIHFTPDFLNDDNAANKHVWSEIESWHKNNRIYWADNLQEIALKALQSPNPARYICEKFIELKEKS